MGIRRRDCCCTDWRDQIRQIWERTQEMTTAVGLNGDWHHPDGQGQVDLGWVVGDDVELTDMETYYKLTIDENTHVASLTDMGSYWELSIGGSS